MRCDAAHFDYCLITVRPLCMCLQQLWGQATCQPTPTVPLQLLAVASQKCSHGNTACLSNTTTTSAGLKPKSDCHDSLFHQANDLQDKRTNPSTTLECSNHEPPATSHILKASQPSSPLTTPSWPPPHSNTSSPSTAPPRSSSQCQQ